MAQTVPGGNVLSTRIESYAGAAWKQARELAASLRSEDIGMGDLLRYPGAGCGVEYVCAGAAISADPELSSRLLSPLYPLAVARRAEASLRDLHASDEWQLTREVLPQLERATAVLAELERFAASRPQRTRLLAALATTLPERTAIAHLDITDSEARIVLVTPQATAAIAAVEAIPAIVAVTLAGQVARQQSGGVDMDRLTLTFKHQAPTAVDLASDGVR